MLQAEHVCSACKDACIIVITGIIKLCVLLFRLEYDSKDWSRDNILFSSFLFSIGVK